MISLIAAVAENGVIGSNNTLPWRLPADLRIFKAQTLGKPIILGRKNYQSIGRPLPGRTNIVVTRDREFRAEGCLVAHSLGDALALAGGVQEVMVIGGAEIYREALPQAQRLYITHVHADVPGDVYFPRYDVSDWRELSREEHFADADNAYDFSFVIYERLIPILSQN